MIGKDMRRRAEQQAAAAMLNIRKRRGMMALIARSIDRAAETVQVWDMVPIKYVFVVAKVTSRAPEALRPDFFIDDPLRAKVTLGLILATTKGRGRPRTVPSETYLAMWRDLRYQTNEEAAVAIADACGIYVSTRALAMRYGASGRRKHKFSQRLARNAEYQKAGAHHRLPPSYTYATIGPITDRAISDSFALSNPQNGENR